MKTYLDTDKFCFLSRKELGEIGVVQHHPKGATGDGNVSQHEEDHQRLHGDSGSINILGTNRRRRFEFEKEFLIQRHIESLHHATRASKTEKHESREVGKPNPLPSTIATETFDPAEDPCFEGRKGINGNEQPQTARGPKHESLAAKLATMTNTVHSARLSEGKGTHRRGRDALPFPTPPRCAYVPTRSWLASSTMSKDTFTNSNAVNKTNLVTSTLPSSKVTSPRRHHEEGGVRRDVNKKDSVLMATLDGTVLAPSAAGLTREKRQQLTGRLFSEETGGLLTLPGGGGNVQGDRKGERDANKGDRRSLSWKAGCSKPLAILDGKEDDAADDTDDDFFEEEPHDVNERVMACDAQPHRCSMADDRRPHSVASSDTCTSVRTNTPSASALATAAKRLSSGGINSKGRPFSSSFSFAALHDNNNNATPQGDIPTCDGFEGGEDDAFSATGGGGGGGDAARLPPRPPCQQHLETRTSSLTTRTIPITHTALAALVRLTKETSQELSHRHRQKDLQRPYAIAGDAFDFKSHGTLIEGTEEGSDGDRISRDRRDDSDVDDNADDDADVNSSLQAEVVSYQQLRGSTAMSSPSTTPTAPGTPSTAVISSGIDYNTMNTTNNNHIPKSNSITAAHRSSLFRPSSKRCSSGGGGGGGGGRGTSQQRGCDLEERIRRQQQDPSFAPTAPFPPRSTSRNTDTASYPQKKGVVNDFASRAADTLTAIEVEAVKDFREVSSIAERTLAEMGYVAEQKRFTGTYERLPARVTYPSLHPLGLAKEVALPSEVMGRLIGEARSLQRGMASGATAHRNPYGTDGTSGGGAGGAAISVSTSRKRGPTSLSSVAGFVADVGGASSPAAAALQRSALNPLAGGGGGTTEAPFSNGSEASRGRFWQLTLGQKLAPPLAFVQGAAAAIKVNGTQSSLGALPPVGVPASTLISNLFSNAPATHAPPPSQAFLVSPSSAASPSGNKRGILAGGGQPLPTASSSPALQDEASLEALLGHVKSEPTPALTRITFTRYRRAPNPAASKKAASHASDSSLVEVEEERVLLSGPFGRKALDMLSARQRRENAIKGRAKGSRVTKGKGGGNEGEDDCTLAETDADALYYEDKDAIDYGSDAARSDDSDAAAATDTSEYSDGSDCEEDDLFGGFTIEGLLSQHLTKDALLSPTGGHSSRRSRSRKEGALAGQSLFDFNDDRVLALAHRPPPRTTRVTAARLRGILQKDTVLATIRAKQIEALEEQIMTNTMLLKAISQRNSSMAMEGGNGEEGEESQSAPVIGGNSNRKVSMSLVASILGRRRNSSGGGEKGEATSNDSDGQEKLRREDRNHRRRSPSLASALPLILPPPIPPSVLLTETAAQQQLNASNALSRGDGGQRASSAQRERIVSAVGPVSAGGGGGNNNTLPTSPSSMVASSSSSPHPLIRMKPPPPIFDAHDSEKEKLRAVAMAKVDLLLSRADPSLFSPIGEDTDVRMYPKFPFVSKREQQTRKLLASIEAQRVAKEKRDEQGAFASFGDNVSDAAVNDNSGRGVSSYDGEEGERLRAMAEKRKRHQEIEEARLELERCVMTRRLFLNRKAFDDQDDHSIEDHRRWKRSAEIVALAKAEGPSSGINEKSTTTAATTNSNADDTEAAALSDRMGKLWEEAEKRMASRRRLAPQEKA